MLKESSSNLFILFSIQSFQGPVFKAPRKTQEIGMRVVDNDGNLWVLWSLLREHSEILHVHGNILLFNDITYTIFNNGWKHIWDDSLGKIILKGLVNLVMCNESGAEKLGGPFPILRLMIMIIIKWNGNLETAMDSVLQVAKHVGIPLYNGCENPSYWCQGCFGSYL